MLLGLLELHLPNLYTLLSHSLIQRIYINFQCYLRSLPTSQMLNSTNAQTNPTSPKPTSFFPAAPVKGITEDVLLAPVALVVALAVDVAFAFALPLTRK